MLLNAQEICDLPATLHNGPTRLLVVGRKAFPAPRPLHPPFFYLGSSTVVLIWIYSNNYAHDVWISHGLGQHRTWHSPYTRWLAIKIASDIIAQTEPHM